MIDFQKAFLYVKNIFEQHLEHQHKYSYREKYGHTLHVYKWAQKLLETEDADILLMGVIFYDVGYTISSKNHMRHSVDICKNYLPRFYLDQPLERF